VERSLHKSKVCCVWIMFLTTYRKRCVARWAASNIPTACVDTHGWVTAYIDLHSHFDGNEKKANRIQNKMSTCMSKLFFWCYVSWFSLLHKISSSVGIRVKFRSFFSFTWSFFFLHLIHEQPANRTEGRKKKSYVCVYVYV